MLTNLWSNRGQIRQAFNARTLTLASVALLFACGGGSDTPTTPNPPPPPPPNNTVTSVVVTPGSVALSVPASVQLTATARNSAGTELTGQTYTWTSSASAVATVAQTGLVTAVAGGTTTITASTSGQQGSAQITVSASPYGPVLDRKPIGPAGGTLSGADVAVTVPAGQLTATSTIELVRDTILPADEGSPRSGARYFVEGLPVGTSIEPRIRIRTSESNSGVATIAVRSPMLVYAASDTMMLGTQYAIATDSSGWWVATVHIVGRDAAPAAGFGFRSSVRTTGNVASAGVMPDWGANPIDAFINVVLNMAAENTANGKFLVLGSKAIDPAMPDKVHKVAGLLETSWTTLTGTLGYSAAHRALWPLQVELAPIPGNGVFSSKWPYPWDQNLSTIGYNNARVPHPEFPGTVIHEVFHMMQQGFIGTKPWNSYIASGWLMEATSTWMGGNHPLIVAPYTNETALSWKDSLYTGLAAGMTMKSGYGKAPMIKYIANRFGNAKVKDIWTSVQGGADPIAAIVATFPEPPAQWWPQVLYQQWGGSLYPWTPAQLMPTYQYYGLALTAGVQEWESDALKPLGVSTNILLRDTAMFGPNFRLPVYLSPVSMGKGRLLVMEKPAAATHFRPIAGTDTVFIPGNRLMTTDTAVMMLTRTEVVAPYNTTRKLLYTVDLRLPDGDWYMPTIKNVNDQVKFACDTGVTMTMDPADNVTSVLSFFAQAGTWTRKANPVYPASYEWAADPVMVDSLRVMGMTLSSTIRESLKDTVYLQARLRWAPSASAISRYNTKLGGTNNLSWWWLLLPIGLVPVAVSKKARRFLPVAGAAVVLLIVSCTGIGPINWTLDETFDMSFTKMRWTADPNDANATLMELNNGVGKTTINQDILEYWRYIYDDKDVKVDSVRGRCVGTGFATYSPSGVAYANGVKPPTPPDDEGNLSQILERSLRVQGANVRIRHR
ncbi:MAG: Ig-like domain-containing protein [Gemmatimonadaceae bacterium]|nr:Ig-like domain-containing protein [Gemmatimonadaceae bacterium]